MPIQDPSTAPTPSATPVVESSLTWPFFFESASDELALIGIVVSAIGVAVTIFIAGQVARTSKQSSAQLNALLEELSKTARLGRIDELRLRLQDTSDLTVLDLLIAEGRDLTRSHPDDREHLECLYWSNPATPLPLSREDLPLGLPESAVPAVVEAVIHRFEDWMHVRDTVQRAQPPKAGAHPVGYYAGELFDFATSVGVDGLVIVDAFVASMEAGQRIYDLDVMVLLGTARAESIATRLRMAPRLLDRAGLVRSRATVTDTIFIGVTAAMSKAAKADSIDEELRESLLDPLYNALFVSTRRVRAVEKRPLMPEHTPEEAVAAIMLASAETLRSDDPEHYALGFLEGFGAALGVLLRHARTLPDRAVETARTATALLITTFPAASQVSDLGKLSAAIAERARKLASDSSR